MAAIRELRRTRTTASTSPGVDSWRTTRTRLWVVTTGPAAATDAWGGCRPEGVVEEGLELGGGAVACLDLAQSECDRGGCCGRGRQVIPDAGTMVSALLQLWTLERSPDRPGDGGVHRRLPRARAGGVACRSPTPFATGTPDLERPAEGRRAATGVPD